MLAINWKEQYSVGIAEIDKQHKKLFDLINQLSESMKTGKTASNIGKIFVELVNYTDQHFKFEEELFKKHGYLAAPIHLKHHNELREKAIALKVKQESGSLIVTVELLKFLIDWVNKHILEEDKLYSEFLISKGVK